MNHFFLFQKLFVDEWFNRIAAADPAVAQAVGEIYAETIAGKAENR
jgi:hypothetical protein